jgi:multidrug resistance efflux pump
VSTETELCLSPSFHAFVEGWILGQTVYNSPAVCKLITLLASVALSVGAVEALTNESAVANYLLASEKEMIGGLANLDKKRALLLKDLELKRGNYARSVQLLSEKIMARKDMELARIEYEKVLIELAAHGKSAASVLSAINKQRAQLHDMTSERGIASTGIGAY